MLTPDTPRAQRPAAPAASSATTPGAPRPWILPLLTGPRFWAAVMAAFLGITAFDFLWHVYVMAPDYAATNMVWRPAAERSRGLAYLTRFLQALAYTYLVLAASRTPRWADTVMAALMIGLVGAALCLLAWIVLPLATPVMPVKWAIGFAAEALFVTVLVKLTARAVGRFVGAPRAPVRRTAPRS